MFVFNDFEALTASACYELSGRRQLKVIQRANCGFLVFHFVLNEALLYSHFPNCVYFRGINYRSVAFCIWHWCYIYQISKTPLTEIFADLMGQTGFIDCSLHSIAVGLLINFLPLSLWGRDVLMAALCKVHTAVGAGRAAAPRCESENDLFSGGTAAVAASRCRGAQSTLYK